MAAAASLVGLLLLVTLVFAAAAAESAASWGGTTRIRSDREYLMSVEALQQSHWQPPAGQQGGAGGGGGSARIANDRTLLLYGGVGLLPFLREAGPCDWPHCSWDWINGGVPQAANLTAHEIAVRERLPPAVRAYNFSAEVNANISRFDGVVMVDYEDWLLEWELADIGLAPYKAAAINFTRRRYPGITDALEIEALAKSEYEAAAMNFFIFTASIVRSMLPNAQHVGFYGYPHYIVFMDHTPAKMRAANDKLLPLWLALGGFYPSLYLGAKSMAAFDETFNNTLSKIDDVLIECNRLNALLHSVGAPPAAILPFTWYLYHPGTAGKYGGQYISAHDAWLEFDYPFNVDTGANTTGVIVWGYEPKPAEAATAEAWFEQQAPYFVNATPPAP